MVVNEKSLVSNDMAYHSLLYKLTISLLTILSNRGAGTIFFLGGGAKVLICLVISKF